MDSSDEELFQFLFNEFSSTDTESEDSTSTSESSDDEEICEIIAAAYYNRLHKVKRPRLHKVETFFEFVHQYEEKEFRRFFRLSRNVAVELINQFADSIHYCTSNHGGVQKLSPEVAVLCFLSFAGNKSGIKDVASRFGISVSSLFRCNQKVTNFLIEIAPKVIKIPETPVEKEAIALEFQKISGFPDTLGCIEDTYIPIATPAGLPGAVRNTYINRHEFMSVEVLAICNYDLKFLDVFTGLPSKIHDPSLFKLSSVYQKIREMCPEKYHVLGSSTYPISPLILTPFDHMEIMSPTQQIYNEKHYATRVSTKNAFILLKKRFRQLRYLEFHTVDKITKFILACCVLHNLCVDGKDVEDFEDVEETDKIDSSVSASANLQRSGIRYDSLRDHVDEAHGEQKRNLVAANLFMQLHSEENKLE